VAEKWTEKNLSVARCIARVYDVPLTIENARTLWLIAGLCDVFEQDEAERERLLLGLSWGVDADGDLAISKPINMTSEQPDLS
jgi:hypothetical protein